MKIAIMGRPRVGKTTYAKKLAEKHALSILHTDDYIGKAPFDVMDQYLLHIVSTLDNYVIEGVQVARMLRTSARAGFPWHPEVYYVNADVECDSKHRGLAILNQNCMDEWIKLGGTVSLKFNIMKKDEK